MTKVFEIKIDTIYKCSLERAFKTAMLCDLSKIHTGYSFMPKVTHVTDDEMWGQPGSSKKVYVAKSLTQRRGFAFVDRILERQENKYWKIQVDDFQMWMLGFKKLVGHWKVTELEENKILVEYRYQLYASNPLLFPFNWLFARLFWPVYMKRVLENVRNMAINNEPYLYP